MLTGPSETGNHWRKIFNVMAKLVFELDTQGFQRWQGLRDQSLLQAESPFALECLNHYQQANSGLNDGYSLEWQNQYFATGQLHMAGSVQSLIVCAYIDYRQLSNARIHSLVALINNGR